MDYYQSSEFFDRMHEIVTRLDRIHTELKDFNAEYSYLNPVGALFRREWMRRMALDRGDEAKAKAYERASARHVECLRHIYHLMPELFGGYSQAVPTAPASPEAEEVTK